MRLSHASDSDTQSPAATSTGACEGADAVRGRGLWAVHECGHFFAARLQNIYVTKFAIGFGPTLLSFTVRAWGRASLEPGRPCACLFACAELGATHWGDARDVRDVRGVTAPTVFLDADPVTVENYPLLCTQRSVTISAVCLV